MGRATTEEELHDGEKEVILPDAGRKGRPLRTPLRRVLFSILSVLFWLVVGFVALCVLVVIALQLPSVQRLLAWRASDIATAYGLSVSMQRLRITPALGVDIRDLVVLDFDRDTLLYVSRLETSLSRIKERGRVVELGRTTLQRPEFNMYYDSVGSLNITKIVRYFLPPDRPRKPPRRKVFRLDIRRIRLFDGVFRLHRDGESVTPGRVNFRNMQLSGLDIDVRNFRSERDTVQMDIRSLSCYEHSGYELESLASRFRICKHSMHFSNFSTVHGETDLRLPLLRMEYTGWKALRYFIDSVSIESSIADSRLSSATLSYFMGLRTDQAVVVDLSGMFSGRVSDFKLRDFEVRAGQNTHILVSGDVSGLPRVEDLIANIEVSTLDTDAEDAVHMINAFTTASIGSHKILKKIRKAHFSGVLTGFFGDFVAYGRLETNVGSVRMDMGLNIQRRGHTDFYGRLSTDGFQLGRILDYNFLGLLNLTADVRGTYSPREGMHARVSSRVSRFDCYGHCYSNIAVKGLVSPRGYQGTISAHDSVVQLKFDGLVDFADTVPVFQFDLAVPHADLSAMGLMPPDSVAKVSFNLRSFFQGNTLDNSQGEVMVKDLRYHHALGTLQMSRVGLVSENTKEGKEFRFDSPAVQAKLWGRRRYAELPAAVGRLIRLHARAIAADSVLSADSAYFDALRSPYTPAYTLLLRVNNVDPVLKVFYPQLRIARGSEVRAEYDPQSQGFSARVAISEASYGGISARDVNIQARRLDSVLTVDFHTPWLKVKGTEIDTVDVTVAVGANRGRVDFQAVTAQYQHVRADMHVDATLRPAFGDRPYSLVLRPLGSRFTLAGREWHFSNAFIAIDTTATEIRNFRLYSGQNLVSVDGLLSARAEDTVAVSVDNLDLAQFTSFLPPERAITGQSKGTIRVGSLLDTMGVATNFRVEDFTLGGAYVGNLQLWGNWRRTDNVLHMRLANRSYDGNEDISVRLDYDPKVRLFDGDLRLNSWDFSLLRSMTLGAVQSRGGRIDGEVRFSGSPEAPTFDGSLRFDNAKVFVQKLGMSFASSSSINLRGRRVLFNGFSVEDPTSHPLLLNGYVELDTLRNPFVSVRATTDRFHLLHTTLRDNPIYYGDLIATTQADVSGRVKDLALKLQARTESGTELVFQLPQQSTARENQYLEFAISSSDSLALAAKSIDLETAMRSKTSLDMELALDVTQAALFTIVIDPNTGGAIKAYGDGRLQLLAPRGNNPMLLYGEYSIRRGEYNFVLGSVLTKKFSIQAGSTVQFDGKPSDAQLNIHAVHEVRTSLDRLILSEEERYKRRVEVLCTIHITGTVQNPVLSFDIDVPQADAEAQGLLVSAMNTEEKKMRQFASLLALGMFFPDSRSTNTTVSSVGGTQVGNMMLSSLSDFLFNQINSWLSSGSGVSIGLGVNYNVADGTNENIQDETEVSFSMQLDQLGLNIDANWDVNRHNTSSAVAGDVNVSKHSKYVKNLQYKAFARSNDNLVFSDLSPYTAGVGVEYSDSFDSLRELWARMKGAFRRKPKEEEMVDQPGGSVQDSILGQDSTFDHFSQGGE